MSFYDPLTAALSPQVNAQLNKVTGMTNPTFAEELKKASATATPRRKGPQPKSVLLCDFCEHPWRDHMAVAGEDPVGFQHCAMVLMSSSRGQSASSFGPLVHQQATIGPKGDTGPAGVAGAPGKDGRSITDVEVVVDSDGRKRLQMRMSDGSWLLTKPW